MKVEAEALDTSLTQRGSQWPVPSAVLMRAVEQNETAYGLNSIRARPVSLVQVRHASSRGATLRGNHADMSGAYYRYAARTSSRWRAAGQGPFLTRKMRS